MSKKVSFILPCYNVERYVTECLDSIYSQGLLEEEFEVICVNDCSTDNTRSIIEEYAQNHKNLLLLDHLVNSGGCGIPRNTGMKSAEGDYICFVDADDWLPQNSMKDICNIASDNNLDIILYNYVISSEGVISEDKIKYSDSEVLSGEEFVEKCLHGNIGKFASAWSKMFKRSFLLQNSIWYTDLIMSEDPVFSWEAMICAKRVKSISKNGYIYRMNNSSMTAEKNLKSPKVFCVISFLYPNELKKLHDKYKDTNNNNILKKGIENEIKRMINVFFYKYLQYEDNSKWKIYSIIQKQTALVWRLRDYMNMRQKIAFMSIKMGYRVFNAMVKNLYN
jgi:glycosyltransferase involved in cell wall biosynthesis